MKTITTIKNNYNLFLKLLTENVLKVKTGFKINSYSREDNTQFIDIHSSFKNYDTYTAKQVSEQISIINSKVRKLPPSIIDNSNIIFKLFNDQSNIEVVLTKDSSSKKYIEIYRDSFLLKTLPYDSCNIKQIYNDAIFGSPSFSRDGTKLVFLGEIDGNKGLNHYYNITNDEKFDIEFEKTLNKFEYKQSFGELNSDKYEPKIVILNLKTYELRMIDIEKQLGKSIYPFQPLFDYANNIIFGGFDFPFFKYGPIYCQMRKSSIYQIVNPCYKKLPLVLESDQEKENQQVINNLTADAYVNLYPNLSTNGELLIYFSGENAVPHLNGFNLMLLNLKTSEKRLLIPKINVDNQYFNGFYHIEDQMKLSKFINNEMFIFSTIHREVSKVFLYDITLNILSEIKTNVTNVTDDTDDKESINFSNNKSNFLIQVFENSDALFIMSASVNNLPEVHLINYNIKTYNYQLIDKGSESYKKLIKLESGTLFNNNYYGFIKVLNLDINSKYFDFNNISNKETNDNSYDTLNILKNTLHNTITKEYRYKNINGYVSYNKETCQPTEIFGSRDKRPVMMIIHGGPNSNFINNYLALQSIALCHGYFVIVINYPGSIGYGQDFINELTGKIGKLDIESCGEYIKNALTEFQQLVNRDKVFIIGGSHGGYLSAWLVSDERYKDLFTAAVIRNPVIDLISMYSTSDIPDWVYGQTFNRDNKQFALKEEDLKSLYEASPISKVHNCKTPILLNLGQKDLRVPHSSGLYFYHSLKQLSQSEIKLCVYPDDSHPLNTPEAELDTNLNIFSWFEKYM